MPADRPTITALRKLAREALGPFAELELYQRWQDPAFYAEVTAPGQSVKGDGVDTWEARRQLRDLLQDIVTGREARERVAFEKHAAPVLDAVMARAHGVVEAQERAKARAPRRRATNGAGYRRKTT